MHLPNTSVSRFCHSYQQHLLRTWFDVTIYREMQLKSIDSLVGLVLVVYPTHLIPQSSRQTFDIRSVMLVVQIQVCNPTLTDFCASLQQLPTIFTDILHYIYHVTNS